VKNTIYAIVAASIAMLATSGIVALATAAPPTPREAMQLVAVVDEVDAEVDDYISEFIDREYQKIVAQQKKR
jgi:hypothetical protein